MKTTAGKPARYAAQGIAWLSSLIPNPQSPNPLRPCIHRCRGYHGSVGDGPLPFAVLQELDNMASPTRIAAWILLSMLAANGAAQTPQLQPFSYHEGFEQTPPRVALWAHNGDAKVNFLGPTDEQAAEGKKSLKLDVTIQSGSYHYWGFALRVPCAGRLKLSARMMVAPGNTAHVGFGSNFVFPPTHHSGCGSIESYSKPTGQWKRIECDLVARGRQSAAGVIANYVPSARGEEVGAMLDRWAIFVTGSPGQRAIVYLDDVHRRKNAHERGF